MTDFWNERYGTSEYAYGTDPNAFIQQELKKLRPGKALFPAEGEGRNAVYAATLGWDVIAYDPSVEGKNKAEKLSQKHEVTINYILAGHAEINFEKESFDCVVLNFAHMPSAMRTKVHKKLASFLKPGGRLIMESFSKKQINNTTGGPKDVEMLFSKEDMELDFGSFAQLEIKETESVLNEGLFHQGVAALIRVIGIK
jgi:ubiquinone/menaquinone biosynthesis C-methylase UbiE